MKFGQKLSGATLNSFDGSAKDGKIAESPAGPIPILEQIE
jgi:hypothetical protein